MFKETYLFESWKYFLNVIPNLIPSRMSSRAKDATIFFFLLRFVKHVRTQNGNNVVLTALGWENRLLPEDCTSEVVGFFLHDFMDLFN